ncbi:PEP-CTERM sorting domain-containing protein [Edaphobacter modestus]|uniref:Putative secreted protein with PEP-CTERM sorting signal n=1 Tax=Edaphobacter modestus TaxID=388466 RepID=A0A4Q7YVE2_9BACT|nr:PEP-CTERM sorting domain-containing protein [Edaphobacter modestus]RZU41618.1 putative secreted protein with PEP-CTERM sorting signal [Edaphobacter modestus]
MIKKTYLSLSIFVLAVLLGFTSPASADPIVVQLGGVSAFAPIVFTGTIGTTLVPDPPFELDNSGNPELFLNGSSFNIDSPLVLNDLLFVNFPPSIPADGSATGTLFTVDLPLGMTPGLYNGSYFIFGGLTPDDQDLLAEIDFQINAQPASSPIPEPSTWILLASGLGGLGRVVYSRRRGLAVRQEA